MSNKPGSKAAKLGKKRVTPEASIAASRSPTASLLDDVEGETVQMDAEKEEIANTVDAVLQGPDIQALLVTEDQLKKLHPPSPPSTSSHHHRHQVHHHRVNVKRIRRVEDERKKSKRVAVLRPLPPDIQVKATRVFGASGGGCQWQAGGGGSPPLHGTLGTAQTCSAAVTARGMSDFLPPVSLTPPIVLPPVPSPLSTPDMTYEKTTVPREAHALQHWNRVMEDRKQQQNLLSKRLHTSPGRLTMNQGDGYRAVQQERTLIERAIPPLEHGKGYHVGSEFWRQSVRIGDEETGINTSLSCTERGQPRPLELVGVPRAVRREKGVENLDAPSLHSLWQSAPYLESRRQQLSSTLRKEQCAQPDMAELAVVGHAPDHTYNTSHNYSLDSLGEEEEEEDQEEEEEEEEEEKDYSLSVLADSLAGPALIIGEHLLKWEGPPGPRQSAEFVDLRVTFECGVEEVVTSDLPMENAGSTSLYYCWKCLPRLNSLGTVQAGSTQRFYFDTRGGVLLPGQKVSFPFSFKSSCPGVFKETWSLETGPVLCAGRRIRVTLRGVAFQEDTNVKKRADLEKRLLHSMAVETAERLVNQLVDSVATPPHTLEPWETTPTEEQLFTEKNSKLYYHHSTVQQLKAMYNQILRPEKLEAMSSHTSQQSFTSIRATPVATEKERGKAGGKRDKEKGGGGAKEKRGRGGKDSRRQSVSELVQPPEPIKPVSTVPDWDLSTDGLLQVVLGVEDEVVREEKLQLFNNLLGTLSFPLLPLPTKTSYSIVYQLLCSMMDEISGASQRLCQLMGLPQREGAPLKAGAADDQLSSTPSTPSIGGKKDKKGKKLGKDKERVPSRSKAIPGKKTKSHTTGMAYKAPDPTETVQEKRPSISVDPVTEAKYRENFHAAVYEVISTTVERVSTLLPDPATDVM